MKPIYALPTVLVMFWFVAPTLTAVQAIPADKPYKIVNSVKAMGAGSVDYVTADNDARRLYVPRGDQTLVFDLDTLKASGAIATGHAHGVAVDCQSHHAFCSSNPVVMWDSLTLRIIKSITVLGRPDGIFFEPKTRCIYVFSHSTPNITIIDGKSGTIVGTIDLGGAPEQAQSDGQGHLYVELEDQAKISIVDVNTHKVTAQYSLRGKASSPAGLGLDAKNHILFAMCREPAICVVLSASDGKMITTLPIGSGVDGAGFNPTTMEAFSSQSDGTLTIIKEINPTDFQVTQTLKTLPHAKTCTFDTRKNQILLVATEQPLVPSSEQTQTSGSKRGGSSGPGLLDILVVGK